MRTVIQYKTNSNNFIHADFTAGICFAVDISRTCNVLTTLYLRYTYVHIYCTSIFLFSIFFIESSSVLLFEFKFK